MYIAGWNTLITKQSENIVRKPLESGNQDDRLHNSIQIKVRPEERNFANVSMTKIVLLSPT